MKRTGAATLIVAAVLGAGVGFLVDQVLTGSGRPTFTPSIMLPILLVLLGVVLIVLARPISRSTRRRSTTRSTTAVDPFHALRIAMLAKASSIVGSAVGGFAVGLAVFLFTRPATPSLGSMTAVLAAVVGGVVLVIAGLVAEQLCTIGKDDDDEPPAPGADSAAPR